MSREFTRVDPEGDVPQVSIGGEAAMRGVGDRILRPEECSVLTADALKAPLGDWRTERVPKARAAEVPA